MALNITDQVRTISDVTTAVARGDLTKKVEIDVKGEMLDLKSTINNMVSQLSIFASEVTRVALEVGTEGKLGGQAKVEGVQGTWEALTDNVNVRPLHRRFSVIPQTLLENGHEPYGSSAVHFSRHQSRRARRLDPEGRR
jgi:hypothetical protein